MREAHVHDDVFPDGRVGDVLQADVLLDAAEVDERTSACRHGPRCSGSFPEPLNTFGVLPSLIPSSRPTAGRARCRRRSAARDRCVITSNPLARNRVNARRSSRAFWKTPPDSATVRVEARRRHRRGRRSGRRRPGGSGRRSPPMTLRRARRRSTAASSGSGVDDRRNTARRRRRTSRRRRAGVHAAGPALRARSPPAPRRRPPGVRLPARPRRRRAVPCWRSGRSPAPSRVDGAAPAARSAGQARTGASSGSQGRPAAHRCAKRHPVGPKHADVATGQRHVLQVRKPRYPL